jgi:hypothetical protein
MPLNILSLVGLLTTFLCDTFRYYVDVKKQHLLWITASHYFSLVALHADPAKQARYLELCEDVLVDARKESSKDATNNRTCLSQMQGQ